MYNKYNTVKEPNLTIIGHLEATRDNLKYLYKIFYQLQSLY